MKIILGFVGDLASGKGTICRYLKEKYGVNAYRYSTMLRDVTKRLYIPESRENLQLLSKILRENFGQDLMSKVIALDVENDSNEIVAVEGIRRPTDITYLEKMPGFNLIYITADSKTRWERLVKRSENPGDSEKSYEQFLQDEQAEADILIKELGQKAKYTLTNDGTFEEFYQAMENILAELRLQK
ncbi:MAG: AAA family ATPase [Candidatus Magasanikbacteria bacterium]|jgi:dephospho-CoA kinase